MAVRGAFAFLTILAVRSSIIAGGRCGGHLFSVHEYDDTRYEKYDPTIVDDAAGRSTWSIYYGET
jgi:hypothetical protein